MKKKKSKKQLFKQRLGKCYQLAGRYIMDNKNSILVHGTLHFQGKTLEHAWIEENGTVFDLVLDKHFPNFIYYRLFQAEKLKKYNHKQAMGNILKTKIFGVWK